MELCGVPDLMVTEMVHEEPAPQGKLKLIRPIRIHLVLLSRNGHLMSTSNIAIKAFTMIHPFNFTPHISPLMIYFMTNGSILDCEIETEFKV